jgi:hypothetical protein
MEPRTREWKSEFFRRHARQGMAEGLLIVLSARGIDVSEDVRTRIVECTDQDQLLVWGRRAATANSIEDLFE